MKFGKLTLNNFLSFSSAEIDLGEQGLILVKGENRDDAFSISNASGKSALFDAFAWVLWGQTQRGGVTEVVKNGEKVCSVSIGFADDVGRNFKLKRTRKLGAGQSTLELYSGDEDLTLKTVSQTQSLVDKILGVSYDIAISSIFLGQGIVKKFTVGTDSEQKSVLEGILGLEKLGECLVKVRGKLSELDKAKSVLEQKKAVLELRLGDCLTEKETLEKSLERAYVAKNAEIKSFEQTKENLLIEKQKWETKVAGENDFKKQITMLKKFLKKYVGFEVEKAKLESEMIEKMTGVNLQRENVYRLIDVRKSIEGKLQGLKSGRLLGKECPECGRLVKAQDITKYSQKLRTALKEVKEEESEVSEKFKSAQSILKKLEIEVEELSEKSAGKSKSEDAIRELHLELEKVKVAGSRIRELEGRLVELDKEIDRVKSEVPTEYHLSLDKLKEIYNLKKGIKKLSGGFVKFGEEKKYLEFWERGFGNQGLKSFVFDNLTPFLNERVNKYIGILTGGDTEVFFTTQSVLKSGEVRDKFSVTVENKSGAGTYQASSGGEKQKVDICVALALQDLIASRSGCKLDVGFFDEVFVNLDDVGVEKVMELLKVVGKERGTLFVITHLKSLYPYFDQTINVVKEGGASRVEV